MYINTNKKYYIHLYIYIYILLIKILHLESNPLKSIMVVWRLGVVSLINRGTGLHTRNQHFRNHRGFSVALSQWTFSGMFRHNFTFSSIFQRIVTFPAYVHWNCPINCQWNCPMDFHFCDFWCVICCPE